MAYTLPVAGRESGPFCIAVVLFAVLLLTSSAAEAATRQVWRVAEIDLPARFYGNYSVNKENGREEFIFGHPRNLNTFGWLERAPRNLRKASLGKVTRHLKSKLRSDGYKMVRRSERGGRGRWSADFTGRSDGDDFRRRVTVIPVRDGYMIASASSLRRQWETPLAAQMRKVVSRLRVLD